VIGSNHSCKQFLGKFCLALEIKSDLLEAVKKWVESLTYRSSLNIRVIYL